MRECAKLCLRYRLSSTSCLPLSSPICGKIVFHETGPWCQKSWGPLILRDEGANRRGLLCPAQLHAAFSRGMLGTIGGHSHGAGVEGQQGTAGGSLKPR